MYKAYSKRSSGTQRHRGKQQNTLTVTQKAVNTES